MAAAAWAASGLYVVADDQVGVVTRLGVYAGEDQPGLRYHLPAPLETVRPVPVASDSRLEIGSSSGQDGGLSFATRDGFPVNLGIEVSWRVAAPRRFLFGSPQPDLMLRSAAEAAVRAAVAQEPAAALLADDGPAAVHAGALLQRLLDRYHAGVQVTGLRLEGLAPPEAALGGFRDLAAARQDAEAAGRDVDLYRARVLAEARSEAAKTVHAAEIVRDQEVAEAKGEAARFALMDAEYRKAPEVTRERLYTEAMARVLHGVNKVVIPAGRGTGEIALPPDLFRKRPADAPAPPPPPQASASGDGR